jgi:hypothetical protein
LTIHIQSLYTCVNTIANIKDTRAIRHYECALTTSNHHVGEVRREKKRSDVEEMENLIK